MHQFASGYSEGLDQFAPLRMPGTTYQTTELARLIFSGCAYASVYLRCCYTLTGLCIVQRLSLPNGRLFGPASVWNGQRQNLVREPPKDAI